MPTIGKIKVDLFGDTRQFRRSMRQAGRSVNRFQRQAAALRRHIAVLGGALGFGILIRRTGEEAIRAKQLADRLSTNVDAFSRLSRVMSRSGIQMSQTGTILQRMMRRAAEAADGNEKLAATFAELGIDVDEFVKLDPVEAFVRFGEALAKVDNDARRLLLAFRVLDTEGVQALQADLGNLRGEMAKTSAVSDAQAKAVTKVAESWDKLKESARTAFLNMGQQTGLFARLTSLFQRITSIDLSEATRPERAAAVAARRLRTRRALGQFLPFLASPEDTGPPSVRAPMTGTVGGGREFIGGNLERTNQILMNIQRNTERQGAVAQ